MAYPRISLVLAAACFCGLANPLHAQEPTLAQATRSQDAVPNANVVNIHSTFGKDASTQIFVSWRTPVAGSTAQQEKNSDSDVEYGVTNAYGSTTSAATFESGGGLQHHAELSGLTPGTTYHYRVRSGEAVGPDCTFRTGLPADTQKTFTFAVMGDVEGPADGNKFFPGITDWIAERDVDFFVVLGDLAYFGQQQSGWNGFFTSGAPLFQSCVFVPVLGDHSMERLIPAPADVEEKKRYHGTDVIAREMPTLYLEQFMVPDNDTKSSYDDYGRRSLRGLWYSFDYGSAHIVSVENTQELTPIVMREATDAQQPVWVAKDLENTKAPWRFVLSHRAYYPYESEETQWEHVNNRRSTHRAQWDEIFADGRVSLTMGAHVGGWILSHPIINGKVSEEGQNGTVHMKLGKIGDYAQSPGAWEVEQWGTVLPTDPDEKIHSGLVLITVSPDGAKVETWDWSKETLSHSFSLTPQKP